MVATRAEIGQGRRQRTRAALVEAALRVFARMGPEAPTVDDVTAEARVARGSFYNHFASWDALLLAVATAAVEQIEAELAGQRDLPDAAARVGLHLRGYIRKAAADQVWGWAVVRMALVAAPLGTAMRANLAQDVADGIATGRFTVASAQLAQDVILGAGMMGMRSVLQGEAGAEHADDVAEAVLRALGVGDAAAVARCGQGGAARASLQPDPLPP
ncbi:TetR/AcrR family transcriptional regulator [Falsiroseomonas bella]|nr:TetR/AcrR family transcriptional regulator [Falsiroseomonas bella]